jgi:hypothetical protein
MLVTACTILPSHSKAQDQWQFLTSRSFELQSASQKATTINCRTLGLIMSRVIYGWGGYIFRCIYLIVLVIPTPQPKLQAVKECS